MADQVQVTLGANVQGALAGLASFGRAAQLAAAAFVTGFAAATKTAISLADEMGKAAQKAGQSVEEFSRMAYAAKQAGLDTSSLVDVFAKLSKTMRESGSVFRELGISRFSEGGSLRNASDVLGDISEIFQNMPDGARKTALAIQIFGKAGAEMIPMLNQGRNGLRSLKAEADALGATVSKDFARMSGEFGDNLTRIGYGLRGMANDIAKEVLPAMIKLTASVVSFMKETRTPGTGSNSFIGFLKNTVDLMGVGASAIKTAFTGGDYGAVMKHRDEYLKRFDSRAAPELVEAGKPDQLTPDDQIEYLNTEEAIRLRILRNESLFADKSKRWDVDPETKRRAEILYLEQKESLLKKLKLAIDPDADNLSRQLDRESAINITKEDAEIEARLLPILREEAQITERLNQLKSNRFSDSLAGGLGGVANSALDFSARAAETVTNSVTTAIDGLAASMQGLIEGTRNWGDVWRSVQSNILGMVLQLIIRFTVLLALVSALSFLFPGSGFVGKLAGFAGIPGKASGGVIGSGLYQVGERGPEYVVNNSTLNRMGTSYFDSLQAGYTPPQAAPQGGGQAVHIGFIGGPSMVGQWLESREGRAYVADIADQRIREARG